MARFKYNRKQHRKLKLALINRAEAMHLIEHALINGAEQPETLILFGTKKFVNYGISSRASNRFNNGH